MASNWISTTNRKRWSNFTIKLFTHWMLWWSTRWVPPSIIFLYNKMPRSYYLDVSLNILYCNSVCVHSYFNKVNFSSTFFPYSVKPISMFMVHCWCSRDAHFTTPSLLSVMHSSLRLDCLSNGFSFSQCCKMEKVLSFFLYCLKRGCKFIFYQKSSCR